MRAEGLEIRSKTGADRLPLQGLGERIDNRDRFAGFRADRRADDLRFLPMLDAIEDELWRRGARAAPRGKCGRDPTPDRLQLRNAWHGDRAQKCERRMQSLRRYRSPAGRTYCLVGGAGESRPKPRIRPQRIEHAASGLARKLYLATDARFKLRQKSAPPDRRPVEK